jgi:hypothetical protein
MKMACLGQKLQLFIDMTTTKREIFCEKRQDLKKGRVIESLVIDMIAKITQGKYAIPAVIEHTTTTMS